MMRWKRSPLSERTPDEGALLDGSRLEAFSDGVFAVAITLLVLDLNDPAGRGSLAHRLLHSNWPNYAAYAVSFLVIGIIWVNHHDTFKRLRAIDRRLQFLNLLLLMTVVLIPFPTKLLATYLDRGADSHAAAVTYGLVMTLMGMAFTALWIYAARHPDLLKPPYDRAYARRRARQSSFGPVVYAAGGAIGLIDARASLAAYALVAVYFTIGGHEAARSSPTGDD